VYDIIAGTSIGAINASIIINCVLENKEKNIDTGDAEKSKNLKYWKGTPERLLEFWKMVSSPVTAYDISLSLVKNIWDFNKMNVISALPYLKSLLDPIVSGESIRRYCSAKRSILWGTNHI
jgi:NTE family protein